ncbi:PPOX class probable F420-dependent enzyme, Rv0121 family [Amycolatopsis pretoriensis]|uniref:PPOX class probable F420-dependent enzyme, Rv0121 family n=1 Tax=Amycolatopsis pretoriensis TaxID=218821 RepID=A0A1H5Q6Z6_9PSEU|nr:TIGR03668 family PPOX class F420-dependent oxidoreductase [Amycolatopsis pretoriensis]SEF21883.1 PPOX class probable F420-dependent enzyme, Rv0121 family [Amycolatopsis pretoriensis]
MTPDEARSRFAAARVARLATVSAAGVPHLVPVTFAVRGDQVVFAVDHKPKSSVALRRLANIAENPAVCFLADGYAEDWSRLWWTRADGTARVLAPGAEPVSWLVEKYAQYRKRPPEHAVVVTRVHKWSGWTGS